ncbi:LCP family protein required for cell wall assembly [Kitasatospora sp. MAP12-15]|uniref:LCP family protein n=1 Tax=unclassified Kitasatospora TaxID=2633591 RepID=UPI002475B948|nr:LCP family protein [Kitasatospora sp. MAP12-44]MDH6112996.1 LCP family protein required for cell wall assembly [Kitasatospora sp. MAP12-44]
MAEHNGAGRRAPRRRPGAGSTAPRRRTSPLIVAGRTVACATSLAILGTCGFTWYAYTSLTTGLTTSSALNGLRNGAPPRLDNSVNLLLIGLDSRKDMNGDDLPGQFVQDELHAGSSSEVGGYNTNTLMVMHIPANGGQVIALSIPRDDYVQTVGADGKMHKIKEAYGIAKSIAEAKLGSKGLSKPELERQTREAGRRATLATVQSFLGIPIDHFAEVNLLGFYDIAKAVEPIQVCLNHATRDPAMEGQGSGADFTAGLNSVNASQALSFVRQRHNLANGDLDRTHRQQAFIASVVAKLKSNGVLGDLGKMQQLFDVVKKDVVMDDQWNILDFAQQAPNLSGGHVEASTLPIAGFATINGQDVNKVDPAQIKRIVQQLTGHDPAPAPAAPAAPATSAPADSPSPSEATARAPGTVDVVNTSAVAGAAATESKALAALGFTAGRVGQGPRQSRTTVVYGPGAKEAADQIAARYGVTATPGAAIRAGHVELTLGSSYTPPGGGSPPQAAAASLDPQDPVAGLPMQGPPVKMGGIPCVD